MLAIIGRIISRSSSRRLEVKDSWLIMDHCGTAVGETISIIGCSVSIEFSKANGVVVFLEDPRFFTRFARCFCFGFCGTDWLRASVRLAFGLHRSNRRDGANGYIGDWQHSSYLIGDDGLRLRGVTPRPAASVYSLSNFSSRVALRFSTAIEF